MLSRTRKQLTQRPIFVKKLYPVGRFTQFFTLFCLYSFILWAWSALVGRGTYHKIKQVITCCCIMSLTAKIPSKLAVIAGILKYRFFGRGHFWAWSVQVFNVPY